jgi:hypothetical protein
MLTVHIPLPPINTCLIWRELYMYTESWGTFINTQCRCHSVLCHTDSHRIIIVIIHNIIPLLILPWERVSWTFFRLSLYLFSAKPHGFQELFANSPSSIFGRLSKSSFPPDHPKNHLICVDLSWIDLSWMTPLELPYSTFKCFWPPFTRSSLPQNVPRTSWSKWTWPRQSPLACVKFPFRDFLGQYRSHILYTVHLLYIFAFWLY